MIAGSMASPQGSTIAYATVYPLVMVMRMITIQVLIFCWCGDRATGFGAKSTA